ncbi:hypothetical protein EVA_18117 [gut metagenome]|uniref:Uncharacterized protein n=1 Tax=gut metagenome TaxID=749906 RepID=J9C1R9_9ZZZZ
MLLIRFLQIMTRDCILNPLRIINPSLISLPIMQHWSIRPLPITS